jgi:hypothetical protein
MITMKPRGNEALNDQGHFEFSAQFTEANDPKFMRPGDEDYRKLAKLTSKENGLVGSCAFEGPMVAPKAIKAIETFQEAVRGHGKPNPKSNREMVAEFNGPEGGSITMTLQDDRYVILKPDKQNGGGEFRMHVANLTDKEEVGVMFIEGYLKGDEFPGKEAAISKAEGLIGTMVTRLTPVSA